MTKEARDLVNAYEHAIRAQERPQDNPSMTPADLDMRTVRARSRLAKYITTLERLQQSVLDEVPDFNPHEYETPG